MKQHSLGLGQTAKRTRRRGFLDEMEKIVPWADLVALASPFLPQGKRDRPPFPCETMLRIHFMQQWFALSDPAMEETQHDMPVLRESAGIEGWDERLPDESTILRLRHVLQRHKLAGQTLQTVSDLLSTKGVMLKSGTVVDATLIAAPSPAKNSSGERDREMSKKLETALQGCLSQGILEGVCIPPQYGHRNPGLQAGDGSHRPKGRGFKPRSVLR